MLVTSEICYIPFANDIIPHNHFFCASLRKIDMWVVESGANYEAYTAVAGTCIYLQIEHC